MFSSTYLSLGERHAIIRVYELPPRLYFKSCVSLLSRYGTNLWSFLFSVSAVITFLKTNRLLLISILSFACTPVVPVKLYFSDPAKSTSYNRLTVTFTWDLISYVSIVSENMLWLLLENSFKLCEAKTLFVDPNLNNFNASSADWHSNTYRFSTTN
jgi:hypothetical protein